MCSFFNQIHCNDNGFHVSIAWNILSCSWGEMCNELPYKKWKKYKGNEDNKGALKYYSKLIIVFCYMGIALGISKEEFYNLYMSKLAENIDRQKRGY